MIYLLNYILMVFEIAFILIYNKRHSISILGHL